MTSGPATKSRVTPMKDAMSPLNPGPRMKPRSPAALKIPDATPRLSLVASMSSTMPMVLATTTTARTNPASTETMRSEAASWKSGNSMKKPACRGNPTRAIFRWPSRLTKNPLSGRVTALQSE
jgi:hypothetical protein